MLTLIWAFMWSYGTLGFLGMVAYSLLGLIVFWNTVANTPSTPKFFRFLFFCALCGPMGWIAFPFWLVYQILGNIEIKQIGRWLAGNSGN